MELWQCFNNSQLKGEKFTPAFHVHFLFRIPPRLLSGLKVEGSRSAHDLTCHSAQELCPKVAVSETWVPQTPLDYHDSHHFPYSCGYPIFRDTHLVNGLAIWCCRSPVLHSPPVSARLNQWLVSKGWRFHVNLGIRWGLSKIMVPKNCPYAALSRTFRALSRPSRIGTWDFDKVFVCKFVTKIYRRIVFKNVTYWISVFKAALVTFLLCVMSLFQSTESMALGKSVFLWGRLTSGHWFCTHSLKSF